MSLNTNWLILERYIICIGCLIIAIYFIMKILKYLIKKENIFTDKYVSNSIKESMKKYPLRYNIANIVMMTPVILFMIYANIIFLPDIPNIIRNKYEVEECTVKDVYTDSNNTQRHSLYCENDNGKSINFVYVGEPLSRGIKIQAYYYKHIEIGQVVKIIE